MLLYLTSNSEAIKGKIDNLITFKMLSSIWGITSEIKSNNKKETGEIFAIYTSGKGPIFLRFYSNWHLPDIRHLSRATPACSSA